MLEKRGVVILIWKKGLFSQWYYESVSMCVSLVVNIMVNELKKKN